MTVVARRLLAEITAPTEVQRFGAPFPLSAPQQRFKALTCLEALYGGAAGGGKSAAMIDLALEHVHHRDYVALLIRRTYKDLSGPGGLMDLSRQWLAGTGASFHIGNATWTFPSGARLVFGHLSDPDSHERYQGLGYNFLGFDELTHHREHQYRWLLSRLRKAPGAPFPSRVRATANPGGPGHDWVKARFVDPATRDPDADFVPALLQDNPGIDHEDYRKQLSKLPAALRAQLEHGDWDARADGNLVQRGWFKYIDASDVPHEAIANSARFWDLAATEESPHKDPDYTSGVRLGEHGGTWYVLDRRKDRLSALGVEKLVRSTADQDGTLVPVGIEQEPGSSGKAIISHYQRNVLVGYACRGILSSGSKVQRAGPFAAACEAGNVYLVRAPWNADYVDTWCGFPFGAHDDDVDASSGAMGMVTPGGGSFEISLGAPRVGVRGALGLNGGVRSHLR